MQEHEPLDTEGSMEHLEPIIAPTLTSWQLGDLFQLGAEGIISRCEDTLNRLKAASDKEAKRHIARHLQSQFEMLRAVYSDERYPKDTSDLPF